MSNWKYWCEKTTILKCNGELFFDIFYLECIVPLPIKKINFSWCDIAFTICKLFFLLSSVFIKLGKLLLFVSVYMGYFKPNESRCLGLRYAIPYTYLFYVHKGLVDPFWYSYFRSYWNWLFYIASVNPSYCPRRKSEKFAIFSDHVNSATFSYTTEVTLKPSCP